TVRVWNARSAKQVAASTFNAAALAARFAPDGRNLLIAVNDGTAWLWDIAKEKADRQMRAGHAAASAILVDGGKRALTATLDHAIGWWDVATGAIVGRPSTWIDRASFMAFSHDGRQLITHSVADKLQDDGTVLRLWESATGKSYGAEMRHDSKVGSALF